MSLDTDSGAMIRVAEFMRYLQKKIKPEGHGVNPWIFTPYVFHRRKNSVQLLETILVGDAVL